MVMSNLAFMFRDMAPPNFAGYPLALLPLVFEPPCGVSVSGSAMSIRSTYYRTDDLVGLSRVYAASSDAANHSDAASARASALEGLRRERQALEARNRRYGEIEQHVSAARQLGYARRMQELQADAETQQGERAQESGQENVPPPPPPSGGKPGLEQARQRYASFVTTRAPEWEQRRREVEAETIARLRGELRDVQVALLTMALLTMALLTMALLTMALLTTMTERAMATLSTATLTSASCLRCRRSARLHLVWLHLLWAYSLWIAVQAQRAASQADFAAGLQQRAVRLHEQQQLQGMRRAQAADAAAHASLLAQAPSP